MTEASLSIVAVVVVALLLLLQPAPSFSSTAPPSPPPPSSRPRSVFLEARLDGHRSDDGTTKDTNEGAGGYGAAARPSLSWTLSNANRSIEIPATVPGAVHLVRRTYQYQYDLLLFSTRRAPYAFRFRLCCSWAS